MHAHVVLLAIGLLASGCTSTTPARSSTSVLAPERTWVVVDRSVDASTLEVIQRFQHRGLALTETKKEGGAVVLRFAGARRQVTEEHQDPAEVALAVATVAAEVAAEVAEEGEATPAQPAVAPADSAGSAAAANDETAVTSSQTSSEQHTRTIQYEIGSAFYVRLEARGDAATWISAFGRPMRDASSTAPPSRWWARAPR